MPKFQSVVLTKGKRDMVGETIMVPFLPKDPTQDDIQSYKAAYLEPACEAALGLGKLPIPFNDKGECFAIGDVSGWEEYKKKFQAEFDALEKADAKKRKPYLSMA